MGNLLSSLLHRLAAKPQKPRFTTAVILAGGSSTRMGEGISKQWLTLDGLPVVARTLMTFEACDLVDEMILVAKEDELPRYGALKERYGLTKLSAVVAGGADRQTSAKNGFYAISKKATFVAIHDGARCLVTDEEIRAVCRAAYATGAATAAARVSDTVKIATKDGFIEKTVDRDLVFLAQTPQIFSVNLYHAATAVAARDGITVTDDCSLVEHIEHAVKLVPCSPDNIKLTVPEDVARAEAILARRREETL